MIVTLQSRCDVLFDSVDHTKFKDALSVVLRNLLLLNLIYKKYKKQTFFCFLSICQLKKVIIFNYFFCTLNCIYFVFNLQKVNVFSNLFNNLTIHLLKLK